MSRVPSVLELGEGRSIPQSTPSARVRLKSLAYNKREMLATLAVGLYGSNAVIGRGVDQSGDRASCIRWLGYGLSKARSLLVGVWVPY